MTGTSFREGSLDGLVHVEALDIRKWDGLVGVVHDRKVLDVFQSLDGDSGLHPAGSPVGEVVPTFGIFVDGVRGIGEVSLHHLPRPCPGEIGKVAFLLRVLVAVHCTERLENSVFLHRRLFMR